MYFLLGSSVLPVDFEHLSDGWECYVRILKIALQVTINSSEILTRVCFCSSLPEYFEKNYWSISGISKKSHTLKFLVVVLLEINALRIFYRNYFHHWQICNNSWRLRVVNYRCKVLHLRWLRKSWIRLWSSSGCLWNNFLKQSRITSLHDSSSRKWSFQIVKYIWKMSLA